MAFDFFPGQIFCHQHLRDLTFAKLSQDDQLPASLIVSSQIAARAIYRLIDKLEHKKSERGRSVAECASAAHVYLLRSQRSQVARYNTARAHAQKPRTERAICRTPAIATAAARLLNNFSRVCLPRLGLNYFLFAWFRHKVYHPARRSHRRPSFITVITSHLDLICKRL